MSQAKIFFGLVLVLATTAFGPRPEVIFDRDGHKLPDAQVNSAAVNWELMKIEGNARFNGVGLLKMASGSCTAALLDTGARGDEPAYILSNGHCVGPQMMGSNDILVDRPANGEVFRLNFFVDAGSRMRAVPVRRLMYGTMKGTDISVWELDVTYRQLKAEGFASYRLDPEFPAQGEPITMVGVPGSGVDRATRYLRRSNCEIGGRVNLREGSYAWVWALRHQCSSVGGSSGSPMISLRTGHIVAVNNTGVNDNAMSEQQCALNRPCEVSKERGIVTNINVNYAQRTQEIATCFDARGVFDMNVRDCQLERP